MTEDDRAWVAVDTPLTVPELVAFCGDVERLYRLNPCLEFDRWEPDGPGFRVAGRNTANGQAFAARITVTEAATGIEIAWEGLLKTRTTVTVEPLGQGARLLLCDHYGGAEAERQARLAEVDPSLAAWGRALHRFLPHWRRWAGFAPWRWGAERVWLRLRPSARRIALLLLWVTAAEFAALLVMVAVLRNEG